MQSVIKNQNPKKSVSKYTHERKNVHLKMVKDTESLEDRRQAKEAVEGTMYKKEMTRLIMKRQKKPMVPATKTLKIG